MRLFVTLIMVTVALPGFAQDWAKAKVAKSPRHGEYVKVKHGNREVVSYVVYPEVKEKATSIVVIHEIFGLSDWVKLMTDELAEAGYIAIAPDLLSGTGPKGGGTDELGGDVRKTIMNLQPEQITADLKACADYVKKLPAANGKVACAGFCWGGGQALRMATTYPDLKASLVFYGTARIDDKDVAKISGPVYGFYGENDARINMTIPDIKKRMLEAQKTYEPIEYKGGGHGFMRAGADPSGSDGNKAAREEAWKRIREILKKV